MDLMTPFAQTHQIGRQLLTKPIIGVVVNVQPTRRAAQLTLSTGSRNRLIPSCFPLGRKNVPLIVDFHCRASMLRHSLIHAENQPRWTAKDLILGVDYVAPKCMGAVQHTGIIASKLEASTTNYGKVKKSRAPDWVARFCLSHAPLRLYLND